MRRFNLLEGFDRKILMVTPSYYPVIGGTEATVQNLAENLRKTGTTVDVMTYNMNERWYPKWEMEIEEINSVKVIKIPGLNIFSKFPINPFSKLIYLNSIPKLNIMRVMQDYDILHFHDDIDLSLPVFSSFIKKSKIFHYHTLSMTYNFYKKNFLARYFIKKAFNVHICNSKSTLKLLGDLGIPANQSKLLYNGVDTNTFAPNDKFRVDNLVLYVGRINWRKGLHVLLDSLSFLKTPIKLVIIGPISDSKYFNEISKKIDKGRSKSKHEIKYLGPVDQDSLVKWYQRASIFVCPSIHEPLGIVNIEALACGTPVVASNVGGIPEIIKNNENGILVPPNDPIRMGKAIEFLLENEEKRTKYGKNGRKMVEKYFSWRDISKKLMEIYEEIE